MSGAKDLEKMRRTKAGWGESDFFRVLEYYDYDLVRQVRHGTMYRHKELAEHPDLYVRQNLARVIIPKGRQLKEFVAEEVIASVDALLALRKKDSND